jgi:hypothetical protein
MGGSLCICRSSDAQLRQFGDAINEFVGFERGEAWPALSEDYRRCSATGGQDSVK